MPAVILPGPFQPATALLNGAQGLVPQPVAGQEAAVLTAGTGWTVFVEAAEAAPVQTVAGRTGNIVLAKADITGIGNVDNTSDANKPVSTATQTALDLKVDAVGGKGLSTEDYTTTEKAKLAGIATAATANASNADLRDRTTHTGAQAIATVTGLQTALDGKQATLVSATNIKTINGTSILGSGDIEITSGGGGTTNASDLSSGTLAAARLPAFSGDITTSAGSASTTLATVNSNVGSFGSATAATVFTVNAKGLVTAASTATITPAFSSVTSKPTTLSGYGITDAQPVDADLTAIAALTTTPFGRSLLTQSGAGSARTTLGVDKSTRNTFTQASHTFAAEDVLYHNGTVWVKGLADDAETARAVGVVESVVGDDFVLVFGGDIALTGKTPGALYYLSPTVAGALTATEPTAEGHYRLVVLEAVSATVGVVRIEGAISLALVDLTTDASGILPADQGGAGAVTGILKADGEGLVSAAEAGTDYEAVKTTVSEAEAEAGTSTTVRNWTAERVHQAAIAAVGEVGVTNTAVSTYGAGTTYSLTTTPAQIDLGTTDPIRTLTTPGTYLLQSRVYAAYNGATFAAPQTAKIKLRRTNNTAADITNGDTTAQLRILTTTTDSVGALTLPPVIYTTSNNDDSLSLFGEVSATPSAGSVDVREACIVALFLYPDTTAPTLVSATIGIDGLTLTLGFSEKVVFGSGDITDFALDATAGPFTIASYDSGTGTATIVCTVSRAVDAAETVTLDYVQPGDGVTDLSSNLLASFTEAAVVNDSEEGILSNDVAWTEMGAVSLPGTGDVVWTEQGSVYLG